MMKNFERLVFYPTYCIRYFEHLIMKSLKDSCPFCGKKDKIRHSFGKNIEAIMSDSKKKKGKKEKKTSKQINEEFNISLAGLQDSLVSLRVVMKYMQYDLEATKRENKILKTKLQKYEGEGEPPIDS